MLVAGREGGVDIAGEFDEGFFGFAGNDGHFGEVPVAEGVAGADGLAFGGDGAAGFGSVGTGGRDLGGGAGSSQAGWGGGDEVLHNGIEFRTEGRGKRGWVRVEGVGWWGFGIYFVGVGGTRIYFRCW